MNPGPFRCNSIFGASEYAYPSSFMGKVNGGDVSLCNGFRPSSVFGQSIYTTFNQIQQKVENSLDLVASYRSKFEKSGLFSPTAAEMKLNIQGKLSNDQASLLTRLLELSNDVRKLGSTHH